MNKRRVRVVNANTQSVVASNTPVSIQSRPDVLISDNPHPSRSLTQNEIKARVQRRYATATTLGNMSRTGASLLPNDPPFLRRFAADVVDSGSANFYSPQLSTDFLEKPQNLRERRAFYRFMYNTNEYVGQSIDIHTYLPLSKLRLVPPKGKNKHQNNYVFKFFQDMIENMKLFKTLIEMTHEYNLFGVCIPGDALLRTPAGFIRADQVHVGDQLLTHRGRWRKVITKFTRNSDELLKFRIWKSFRDLSVTREHPVEIVHDGGFKFVPSGNVKKNDFVKVTFPKEINDIDSVRFVDFPNIQITPSGYKTRVDFIRSRSQNAFVARAKLVEWLLSLKSPVIRTRASIAADFGVPVTVLSNVISRLEAEINSVFHRRIGADGYQRGSRVMWYPIEESVKSSKMYEIARELEYSSPHSLPVDEDFAYLVGYWLGGGTFNRSRSRTNWGHGRWNIAFGNGSEANHDRILEILNRLLPGCVKTVRRGSSQIIHVRSNPAFLEWWYLNFGGTTKHDTKKIPLWFIELPLEKQKAFLAGVLDSDGSGSVTKKTGKITVSVTMCSQGVIESIREIGLRCGAVCNYNTQEERLNLLPNGKRIIGRRTYILSTMEERSCKVFTEKSCKKIPDGKFSKMDRYFVRVGDEIAFKIRAVKKIEGGRVFNFEVQEDHTYQVNGFSTHNCFSFAEDSDYTEILSPEERSRAKETARQRAEFLKEKFGISDNDPLYKGWKKIIILPPDQVRVRKLPLTDDVAIEYVPDPETKKFITSEMPLYPDVMANDPVQRVPKYEIPAELREKVMQSGAIPLDTDPNTGSFVYTLTGRRSQYEPFGQSRVERCVNTLVYMDKLRQAQTSIASRHMTPMRIVWAEQLNPDDVDQLREQVDLALVDPDYSIIANYEVHWEEMGSQGRLLDIDAEMESCANKLFAGLGVTREILTGEGSYTGSKISLEIMNQQYLLFRELIQDYAENYLFKPVARKKGFIELDEYGNETLLYPRLSFTRLAIRDNEQFFDAAFQLYQKGSISIDLILDILNIDPSSTREKLEQDLFTVNDSQFNEVLRNLYTNVSTTLVEQTDLTQKLAKYLKLNFQPPAEEAEGASRFSTDKTDEQKKKLLKVMAYFQAHPEQLDKVFGEKSYGQSG